ncbi:MAG: glycosyltransferase family 2 protein [Vicinamibacterales bacterium]
MAPLLLIVLAVPAALLSIFVAYEVLFACASIPSLLRGRALAPTGGPQTVRLAVIIPAHNESKLIEATVRSLLGADYPAALRDVIVIADNCTDDTAALARGAGALCHERHDEVERGKPYALRWIIDRLDLDRYDGLIVIDADTVVDKGFLSAMAAHLARGEVAVQGYFGVRNPDETWLTRLAVVPGTIKYRLHYPGKWAFRLSCPLAGNGMCFAVDLVRKYGWTAFSLTENWEYYVQLALRGHVVAPAAEAVIWSQVARTLKQGETQRSRWMRGRIDTLRRYWRPLLGQGLSEPSLVKLDALVEVARPSHSILMSWTLMYMTLCGLARMGGLEGANILLLVAGVILGAQVTQFLVALALERPPLRTWLALLMVPWYIAWKLAVSIKGLRALSQRSWVKTVRN